MALHGGSWAVAAAARERAGEAYVLATVLSAAGSTPREAGAKMVIGGEDSWASVGGGQLEFLVMQRARALLAAGQPGQWVEGMPLAADARQCCGGSVSVLFEVIVPGVADVAVFGAGHVAQALMPILAELGYRLRWIDTRRELLAGAPANVDARWVADPLAEIAALRDGSDVLVLSHDHELDFRLVEALLTDWRWRAVGLIGSRTKARRFRARLARAGLPAATIDRLECPVGAPGIPGKRPMAVAVAIAAVLRGRDGDASGAVSAPPLDWRRVRALLADAGE